MYLDIFECRQSNSHKLGSDTLESMASSSYDSSETLPSHDGAMDEPLVASHDTPQGAQAAWFGGGKKLSKMFKSPVSMVKRCLRDAAAADSSLMGPWQMVAPVASMARGVVATTVATKEAVSLQKQREAGRGSRVRSDASRANPSPGSCFIAQRSLFDNRRTPSVGTDAGVGGDRLT